MTSERERRRDIERERISSRSIHKLHKIHSQIFTSARVISESVDILVLKSTNWNQLLFPQSRLFELSMTFLSYHVAKKILYRQLDCAIETPFNSFRNKCRAVHSRISRFREGDNLNEIFPKNLCFDCPWGRWKNDVSSNICRRFWKICNSCLC